MVLSRGVKFESPIQRDVFPSRLALAENLVLVFDALAFEHLVACANPVS
jgi:hypothetical protein